MYNTKAPFKKMSETNEKSIQLDTLYKPNPKASRVVKQQSINRGIGGSDIVKEWADNKIRPMEQMNPMN